MAGFLDDNRRPPEQKRYDYADFLKRSKADGNYSPAVRLWRFVLDGDGILLVGHLATCGEVRAGKDGFMLATRAWLAAKPPVGLWWPPDQQKAIIAGLERKGIVSVRFEKRGERRVRFLRLEYEHFEKLIRKAQRGAAAS